MQNQALIGTLKKMQQLWDVIWMAASVFNVKYLDTFWNPFNSFFDSNDFCKDWYYPFIIPYDMHIVCH